LGTVTRGVERVFGGYAFLECPRWHDGRLWVSDFYTHQVLSVVPGQQETKVIDVPGQPSGLGWLPDGDLLVVSMKHRQVMRYDGVELSVHADLSDLAPSHLNDMVVDEQGRAYVGNFGSDMLNGETIRRTNLICVEPDGTARSVADELFTPNGMVISPDGSTLIVAESFGGCLTAFDIAADGSLSNRRPWAVFSDPPTTTDFVELLAQLPIVPDGMTLDAEGAVWVADGVGRRAIRVLDGQIVDEVSTAEEGLLTVACALGGDDGRTLFLCGNPVPGEEASLAAMGAALLSTTVTVPHAGRP
jgi:sugar lactone lactonase YvrE